MSNRAQRRAMMRNQINKSQQLLANYSKQQRIAGLVQNGITPKDLEDEFQRGRETGFKEAAEPIIKSCYAGICIALHDEFGFGRNRCYRAIKAVDEKIICALNHQELVEETLEKTGLILQLDEPFERVQKAR